MIFWQYSKKLKRVWHKVHMTMTVEFWASSVKRLYGFLYCN